MTENIIHFLLHIAVEAQGRQTVCVKLSDLQLPASVVDQLAAVNSTPVRAPMSAELQKELNQLRVKQRAIYDDTCIYASGQHFLVSSYFMQYKVAIEELRKETEAANARLKAEWEKQYTTWADFVHDLLEPVLGNSPYYDSACQQYIGFFPTKKEFGEIKVNVLGPLRIDLTPTSPEDHLLSEMETDNISNTAQLLDLAKGAAESKAAKVCSTLLDELDAREDNIRTIGRVQTGTAAKRGSWQLAAEQMLLISRNVSGYAKAAELAQQLLDAGLNLQSRDKDAAQRAYTDFNRANVAFREEVKAIHAELTAASKPGADVLGESISMTSEYKRICASIEHAPDQESLEEARLAMKCEQAVMTQRVKKMEVLIKRREEMIEAEFFGDAERKQLSLLPDSPDF